MKLINVLEHHLKGGSFQYKSFDFKKAALEYEQTKEWQDQLKSWSGVEKVLMLGDLQLKDKYQIPEEIREKYSYFRKGKIRSVHFSPNGSIFKILIGAKYAVSFYEHDLKDLILVPLK